MNIHVPAKIVNGLKLKEEMEAIAGEAWQGWSQGIKWPGVVILHLADGTPEAVQDAVKLVYENHNANVQTSGQQLETRQLQAAADLALEDFTTLRDAINALSVSAEVKQVLRRLNRNSARLALAIRASVGTDPGA